MQDEEKSKEELISELRQLRLRVNELESSSKSAKYRPLSYGTEEPSATNIEVLGDAEVFRKLFKEHLAIMYVVDLSTFSVIDANETALKFYGYDKETMLTKRVPDLNITPEPEIRAEIKRAIDEGRTYYVFQHQLANGDIRDVEIYANPVTIKGRDYSFSIVHDITEHKKTEEERERLIQELKSALDEIKNLQGILPICSFCKKIRDDKGYWNQVEEYIAKRTDVHFSHAMCPDCAQDNYPDYFENK